MSESDDPWRRMIAKLEAEGKLGDGADDDSDGDWVERVEAPAPRAKANGVTHQDHEGQFREFAASEGYPIRGDIIADGKVHRFGPDNAYAYCLHLDGVPNGWVHDWRSNGRFEWKANGLKLNHEDRKRRDEQINAAKAEREADKAQAHEGAAAEAERIWGESTPARDDQSYLVRKNDIKPHGAREYHGARPEFGGRVGRYLVIPLWNDGARVGLQFINEQGDKRFLKGSLITGSYFAIGDVEGADKLAICEGFATAATIEERTGIPCLVAFNAGNLLPAAQAVRAAFPDAEITIAADDDWKRVNPQTGKPENIGQIKAREAAQAIGAKLAIPNFAFSMFDLHRGEKDTDFNDLDRLDHKYSPAMEGCWGVQTCIGGARYVEEVEQDEHAKREADPFKPFAFGDLLRDPAPARRWLVPDFIPAGQVTLLAGDGGIGKSTVALQLAAAVATGTSWLGMEVKQGRVAVLSAEDDKDEMHFRMQCIVRGIDGDHEEKLQALNNVRGIDATKDLCPLLASFDEKSKAVEPAPTFEKLQAFVVANEIDVVILDSATDVFNEEINRHGVRSFIRGIRSLADTVILLGHPSVSGMQSGRGYSGSTHWNNAVRSRLHFTRATDAGGNEIDPDLRFLELGKSNRSRAKQKLALRWTENGFIRDEKAAAGLDELSRQLKAEEVFLRLLRQYCEQGRAPSPNVSSGYAPKLFADDPGAEGISKEAFKRAMNILLSAGKIEIVSVKKGREYRERLKVVEGLAAADEEGEEVDNDL